jgi:hypothetical protein
MIVRGLWSVFESKSLDSPAHTYRVTISLGASPICYRYYR